ncbi:hypothetical protein SOM10_11765 [Microbacterium sp. CFBP9023]|uniref:hypothetical protein n=1 Tax=Microbacterium sp. CFBP9023 TaxID=3096535 RepID=UPI002A69F6DB|nr:hypothetical protein [Microbacterium sp. CFBP9023]MDY0984573.1 hypothetical protein [Microbacterium sp. CFBP9023]
MDPVHEKLAIRIANDAVTIASLEARAEALSAEIARLQAAASEAAPSPEGDED